MAELINEIVGQKAYDEVALLDKQLGNLVDKFEKNTRAALLLEAALSKLESIKDFKENVEKLTKANEELERDMKKVQAANERLKFAQSEYGKQVAATSVEIEKQNKANKNAAREAQAAEDSVNKMSAALIRLRSQYDALSKADRESAKGKGLLGNIQALDIELKAIDGTLGRFGRNVGNYGMIADQLKTHLSSLTTQWAGMNREMRMSPMGREMEGNIRSTTNAIQLLGASAAPQAAKGVDRFANATMSVSQVLRELPAFTYSAQTGILGISNNLPILADQFKKVKEETGSTSAALKIFGASIFSFGNILTIALGLFTIYSKEIFAAFQGTTKLASAQSDLNKAMDEGNKNAVKEVTQLDVLYKTTQNTTLSIENRKKAVDKLQELYPSYFGNLNDEIILNGQAKTAYNELRDAIFASARARSIQGKLEERAALRLEQELKLREEIDRYDNLSKTAGGSESTNYGRTDLSQPNTVKKTAAENRATAEFQKQDAIKRLAEFRQASLKEDDLLLQAQQDYYAKSDKLEADRIHNKNSPKGKDPKGKPVIDPNLSDTDLADLKKYYENLRKVQIEAMGEMINDPESKKAFEEFLQGQINTEDPITDKQAQDLLDSITNRIKEKAKRKEISLKFAVDLQVINEIIQAASNALTAINDIQYQREMANIDAKEKKQQEAFDAEQKRINSSFTNQADKERELAKLEAVREAQKKRIDRDRIAAERKRAIQQKAYDVASIISGTAVAVVAALGSKPYTPLNIAIAAGVAASGAANLARAIAAPIPQYADGVKSKPTDGLALVGEAGTELVKLPSGQSFLTSGPTIMDLPKKTEVISNEDLMKEIYAVAFRKMASAKSLNSDVMADAFIESIEENTSEIKLLRKDVKDSRTNVSIYGDFNHYMHVQNNIR